MSRAWWGAIVACFLTAATAHARSQPPGVVGDVSAVRGELRAGPDGATVQLDEQTTLRLSAGARYSIRARATIWFPRLGMVESRVVELQRGQLLAELSRPDSGEVAPLVVRTARGLTVATLGGRLAVRSFSVAAASNVAGSAFVRKQGTWKRLSSGYRALKPANESEVITQRALEAPSLRAARRLWVVERGPASPTTMPAVEWSPVPGARSYMAAVYRSDGERALMQGRIQTTHLVAALAPVEPGLYRVEVSAVDEYGLPGIIGALELVGVGMTVDDDGALEVPNYSASSGAVHVRLTYAEGLEMRLGGARTWFAALPSLLLQAPLETEILLRHPADLREVRVPIASPHVSADVHLGPATATWPQANIKAQIELKDAVGGARATNAGISVVSMLGTERLELAWHRNGALLWADIPRQQGPGPWVIRVSVRDARKEIGRGFLEVVRSGAQGGRRWPGRDAP